MLFRQPTRRALGPPRATIVSRASWKHDSAAVMSPMASWTLPMFCWITADARVGRPSIGQQIMGLAELGQRLVVTSPHEIDAGQVVERTGRLLPAARRAYPACDVPRLLGRRRGQVEFAAVVVDPGQRVQALGGLGRYGSLCAVELQGAGEPRARLVEITAVVRVERGLRLSPRPKARKHNGASQPGARRWPQRAHGMTVPGQLKCGRSALGVLRHATPRASAALPLVFLPHARYNWDMDEDDFLTAVG